MWRSTKREPAFRVVPNMVIIAVSPDRLAMSPAEEDRLSRLGVRICFLCGDAINSRLAMSWALFRRKHLGVIRCYKQ